MSERAEPRLRRGAGVPVLAAIALAGASGCYHYSFEQSGAAAADSLGRPMVTHEVRAPTYLNGFVGTGAVDTSRFCDEPIRTELRVTATDVLLSVATLLIYTPHTLYVTCLAEPVASER
jgi:hypothetical protein